MIIWELILKEEDVCGALARLYSEMGVGPLSMHLGVSRVSLIRKLKECNIQPRKRGGPHNRVDMNTLPSEWWKLSTDELVGLTGYCANYVRRLKREKIKCASADSTKTPNTDTSTDSKDSQ